jgi:hypothetical protein
MQFLKECLRMEEICTELALREPHNREQWRAKARMWHQRAAKIVIDQFGDVPIPSKVKSHTDPDSSWLPLCSRPEAPRSRERR